MKLAILFKDSIFSIMKNKYNQLDKFDDIYSYSKISDINMNNFQKYDYIIIISKLCFIDIIKLKEFLNINNPSYASLATYWGIGSEDVCIIHKSIFSKFQYRNKITSLSTYEDNILCELFMYTIGIKKIKTILIKNNYIKYLMSRNKVLNINNIVYNIDRATGSYHDSIFIFHTSDPQYFVSWFDEYQTKQKTIFIDDKTYKTIVGITFFVINNQHIALLGKNNYLLWSNIKNKWIRIKSKIKIHSIHKFIYKKAPNSFRTLKLSFD